MSTILNTYEPVGQMGWGEEFQTVQQKLDIEKRIYSDLFDEVPHLLQPKDPKPVNAELLAKVKELQQADGIDDGFTMLHLTQAVFGQQFDWRAQIIGSCVASGAMRTLAYRMIAESFLLNDPETLFGVDIEGTDSLAPFACYHYRAGRKIGGLNGGDGSFCDAQIKGLLQYGMLTCDVQGLQSDAFPEPQSASLYRRWGNSNSLLEQYADKGKIRRLTESVNVSSADQAKQFLIQHQKPMNICSNWGFAPDTVHRSWKLANGQYVVIYKRSGSWAHNMSVIGFVIVGGQEFVIIENSWGKSAHKNGTWFAIPASLFDSWLRSAECMTVGEIDMVDNGSVWPEKP